MPASVHLLEGEYEVPRSAQNGLILFLIIALPAFAFQATSTLPTEVGFLAQLGVGGVLAGVMWFQSRQDRKSSEARHADREERYAKLLEQMIHTTNNSSMRMAALAQIIDNSFDDADRR